MKHLILAFCFLASFSSLRAQTSDKDFNQEEETPNLNYLKYRSTRFYETDDPYFRGQKIKAHQLRNLIKNTDAFDSWQLHKTFKGLTWGFGGVALAFLGVSIYQTVNSDGYDDGSTFRNAAIGVIILGELPCTILTGVYGRKTAKVYNKYIDHERERYSLGFGPTRNGIGLILKF